MQARGPSYAVELGRKDGLVSRASDVEGKLPQPTFNLNQLNAMFAANGLSQTDMIALSGITFSFPLPHNFKLSILSIFSYFPIISSLPLLFHKLQKPLLTQLYPL